MKRDVRQNLCLFYSWQLRKRHRFLREYFFIFGSSYFVKVLDGRILYLIKPKCGDRFIYFLCQIVSNMMHKSSQNQFGLIEEIKHQSY